MYATYQKILEAYLFLKAHTYHENLNLFLKARLASFEADHVLTLIEGDDAVDASNGLHKLSEILQLEGHDEHPIHLISDLLNSGNLSQPSFLQWLDQINCRILPKDISLEGYSKADKSDSVFLTNNKTAEKYIVGSEKINYFIDAPVELHIIDMLWTLVVGRHLDSKLSDKCYGNRLTPNAKDFFLSLYAGKPAGNTNREVFIRYIDQYNAWRDAAITSARNIAVDGHNCAIFSIDLNTFFYHIKPEWAAIHDLISRECWGTEHQIFEENLCKIVEKIHATYAKKIQPLLAISHPSCAPDCIIPIGLTSSSIIANWHLAQFDHDIENTARPASFGRYVDDILFVFKNPRLSSQSGKSATDDIIKQFLDEFIEKVKTGRAAEYQLAKRYHLLPLKKEKIVVHYFDCNHTLAGLEVFQRELAERSSAFRFLPDDHIERQLEDFAYDVLYDGSAQRFRSIVGLSENETELSRYLSSHIIAHRLCEVPDKRSPLPQLERFFRGQNALKFFRLWEKAFSYALITENERFAKDLFCSIYKCIGKITYSIQDNEPDFLAAISIQDQLSSDLIYFLDISFALPAALKAQNDWAAVASDLMQVKKDDAAKSRRERLMAEIHSLRQSNLVRHNYVTWPLLNFATYNGSLIDRDFYRRPGAYSISGIRHALSPRFIHFDEWQTFRINQVLHSIPSGTEPLIPDFLESAKDGYCAHYFHEDFPIGIKNRDAGRAGAKVNIREVKIGDDSTDRAPATLKIGIANVRIKEEDISNAFRKDRTPNTSYERQKNLYNVLNSSEKTGVELLILPEVSIPVSWLPFMVSHARRHQIGLVFGLEHWVIDNTAYNLIVEALPFRVSEKYRSCLVNIRIKNHYAPFEKKVLQSFKLGIGEPSDDNHYYTLTKWRGINLASYNCFELANIDHRSLFRSELDLLLACVWNKDTNYYDHILESAVRDLFCYVAQANTSQFGGSCVLQPAPTYSSQIIRVKGGENSCVLTATLDLKTLRDAQYEAIRGEKSSLKPTPPGFDHTKVLYR